MDLLELDEDMLVTLRDVHETTWSRTEHLLATIADALGIVGYNALVGPHVDPKSLRQTRPPEPLPRPGVQAPKKRRGTTLGELKKMMSRGGSDA